MYDLTQLSAEDSDSFGMRLAACASGQPTMEAAAVAMVRFCYTQLLTSRRQRAIVLARLYKTHPYGELPPDVREVARSMMQDEVAATTKCFTLLATAGDEPSWNDRRASQRHQAIPLESPTVVQHLPMVAGLFQHLGLDVSTFLQPVPVVASYRNLDGVFYVPTARGSQLIPAQDAFVIPYGIESVVGFGSLLSNGQVFALILFSRVAISRDIATHFKGVALHISHALLGFTADTTFTPRPI